VTWWDERFPITQLARSEAVCARIKQGPPRVVEKDGPGLPTVR
jgi:hypothetical protein